MILLTASDSRALDEWAEKKGSLSIAGLIESAGTVAAADIYGAWKKLRPATHITLVCGPGNNGEDGFVIARHLIARGVRDVRILAQLSRSRASANFDALKALGASIEPLSAIANLTGAFVIDALFGVGLDRNIEGELAALISAMNRSSRYIVSVDCPSGLDSDLGLIRGVCVKANMTVTFARPKIGFLLEDGPTHVGRLRIEPLSFPKSLLQNVQPRLRLYQHRQAQVDLPVRVTRGNKFNFGRVIVIAGREGAWGAGLMAAASALQCGAGYVTWAVLKEAPDSRIPADISLMQPELITEVLTIQNIQDWKPDQFTAIIIGPGLGRTDIVKKAVQAVLKLTCPVVLDADVLSLFGSTLVTEIRNARGANAANVILTPHAGELGRMMNTESSIVQADRRKFAEELHALSGATVIAKGFHTIVAGTDALTIIPSGNSALAKAGSGDVLTGILGALLGLGLETEIAARLGCYLHGLAADLWIQQGESAHTLEPHKIPALIGEITHAMYDRLDT